MGADELLGLHEHPARTAARVVHAALVGFNHLDQELHDGARCVELSSFLSFFAGELTEEVLVDAPENVARIVLLPAEADRRDEVDQLTESALVQDRTGIVLGKY